ncbi:proline-rich receptor-like protein kinase PERK1 [Salvia miltiorrhiza]|uniref:proline-rich receptor-like protein kinase PERK1 n=1 Tax=Salvia miltiorrhiza TaxID=226208 RepID=UPI0025AC59CC|nr:proline-rich receptor-like protein kinase PERK1 [Salvia miltiorrhiza]
MLWQGNWVTQIILKRTSHIQVYWPEQLKVTGHFRLFKQVKGGSKTSMSTKLKGVSEPSSLETETPVSPTEVSKPSSRPKPSAIYSEMPSDIPLRPHSTPKKTTTKPKSKTKTKSGRISIRAAPLETGASAAPAPQKPLPTEAIKPLEEVPRTESREKTPVSEKMTSAEPNPPEGQIVDLTDEQAPSPPPEDLVADAIKVDVNTGQIAAKGFIPNIRDFPAEDVQITSAGQATKTKTSEATFVGASTQEVLPQKELLLLFRKLLILQ